MTKELQRKFIVTTMTVITVLLLFLFASINVVNIIITNHHSQDVLQMISRVGGDIGMIPREDVQNSYNHLQPKPFFKPFEAEKNDYDTFMSSNFFVVTFDSNNHVIFVDVQRTSTMTESDAISLAKEVNESGVLSGKKERFRYIVSTSPFEKGKSIVFLDITNDLRSCALTLLISASVSCFFWGLMLLLTIFLSKKALAPITESIEKQKQFITNAGHEIKTPLAIIQANTEALELYHGETQWSKNIKSQSLRLAGLMQSLLSLAKMDEGSLYREYTEVNLSILLDEMISVFSLPMENKEIILEEDILPDARIHANTFEIEQLISILLDNAVKYTPPSGNISISLKRKDRHLIFLIENTCDCFPPVPPEKLFDRFYRSDPARTQSQGGYGIGLSMAKSIAHSYGYRIGADYLIPNLVRFYIQF